MDPVEQTIQRLLAQLPPWARAGCLCKASGDADRMLLLSDAVDAWLGHLSAVTRGLRAEQEAIKSQFKETGAQSADLRKRIDELERADALAARTVPSPPRLVAVSKADDVGGIDNIPKKRH